MAKKHCIVGAHHAFRKPIAFVLICPVSRHIVGECKAAAEWSDDGWRYLVLAPFTVPSVTFSIFEKRQDGDYGGCSLLSMIEIDG